MKITLQGFYNTSGGDIYIPQPYEWDTNEPLPGYAFYYPPIAEKTYIFEEQLFLGITRISKFKQNVPKEYLPTEIPLKDGKF